MKHFQEWEFQKRWYEYIPFVHRKRDYETCQQGFNWNVDHYSKFICRLLIWRFAFYFRWRSNFVGGHRIILDWAFWRKQKLGFLEYRFESNSYRCMDVSITRELLEDLCSGGYVSAKVCCYNNILQIDSFKLKEEE